MLLVGFILFSLSIVGAGDVKLLSAYSLGVSPEYWWLTIFLILILGAICFIPFTTMANVFKDHEIQIDEIKIIGPVFLVDNQRFAP